jgi:hypothetical protein
LQFSLQAASPETFGYLQRVIQPSSKGTGEVSVIVTTQVKLIENFDQS